MRIKAKMSRPRLLDLFCGAGGAAMGYHRAGFDVVGVDIAPQPRYPFHAIRADVSTYLKWSDLVSSGYDAIHASPPCQAYSNMNGRHDDHPELIAETREFLEASGLPFVIENIEDARDELCDPIMLCGTMWDPPLDGLKRHRLFESNWDLQPSEWPCRHKLAAPRFLVYEHGKWYMSPFVKIYGGGGGKAAEHWGRALGIDWMTRKEMKEAIPPAYTEFIGHQLLAHVQAKAMA
jgi:DNA (cytosine-5)-methyltransferase 1